MLNVFFTTPIVLNRCTKYQKVICPDIFYIYWIFSRIPGKGINISFDYSFHLGGFWYVQGDGKIGDCKNHGLSATFFLQGNEYY